METYGADIIRLWALSVDFTEDHRIGEGDPRRASPTSIASCATRSAICSARSTGSARTSGSASRRCPSSSATCCTWLAELDAKLRQAVDDFDFNTYVRALTDFCNEDLSAFYFDIRKDCLYCEVNAATGIQTDKRRAYRTVLDTLFHALVRWMAPVLVFTTEEVWGTRYPDGGSVHLLEWPEVPAVDARRCEVGRAARAAHAGHRSDRAAAPRQGGRIEPGGRSDGAERPTGDADLAELFIVSSVTAGRGSDRDQDRQAQMRALLAHLPEVSEDGGLCARCDEVLNG